MEPGLSENRRAGQCRGLPRQRWRKDGECPESHPRRRPERLCRLFGRWESREITPMDRGYTRLLLLAAMLLALPLAAQWFDYPTRGVPRTPDGKPNLKAPAPRTADGKPDLSGMWRAANRLPCDGVNRVCGDLPISAQFGNIGAVSKAVSRTSRGYETASGKRVPRMIRTRAASRRVDRACTCCPQ